MTSATVLNPGRAWLERGCRALAVGALALAAWYALREAKRGSQGGGGGTMRPVAFPAPELSADSSAQAVVRLREAVVAQAAQAAPDTLAFTLPAVPAPGFRNTLSALVSAGVPLRWIDSTGARGLALSIAAAPGPRGGFVVRASRGAATEAFVLRDRGGLLDSLPPLGRAGPSDATWRIASLAAPVEARVGQSAATVALPDSASPKRLVVIGQPGWESKFTVAALEELGWRVDGSLRISPTGVVQVGAPQRFDTAHYAAAIVLDSMAVDAAALSRFVQQGGGLVLAGDALRVPALAALRPARATAVRGALAGALLTETPRRGLEAWELDVQPEATVLQADAGEGIGAHAHAEPAVVVRRVGTGRVAATAYREMWRWRMQGTDDGAADHRAWWGAMIAAVAPDSPAPTRAPRAPWPGEAAPYADLVVQLGEPSPTATLRAVTAAPRVPWRPSAALLFVVAATALLVEWASRRLRGLR